MEVCMTNVQPVRAIAFEDKIPFMSGCSYMV